MKALKRGSIPGRRVASDTRVGLRVAGSDLEHRHVTAGINEQHAGAVRDREAALAGPGVEAVIPQPRPRSPSGRSRPTGPPTDRPGTNKPLGRWVRATAAAAVIERDK